MRLLKWLALPLLIASPVSAQVVPNFTQGSMTSTTTTNQTINETIVTERYGGDVYSYSGVNVTPSGPLGDPTTTYTVTDPTLNYQLETVSRPAGLVELETVTRAIATESVTDSLSVFSQ